jgi:hypothetical protein
MKGECLPIILDYRFLQSMYGFITQGFYIIIKPLLSNGQTAETAQLLTLPLQEGNLLFAPVPRVSGYGEKV